MSGRWMESRPNSRRKTGSKTPVAYQVRDCSTPTATLSNSTSRLLRNAISMASPRDNVDTLDPGNSDSVTDSPAATLRGRLNKQAATRRANWDIGLEEETVIEAPQIED